MNHATVRVYNNDSIEVVIVKEENLERLIKYNNENRPGCAFFVDGQCKQNGYLDEERIREWTDKISKMKFNLSVSRIDFLN